MNKKKEVFFISKIKKSTYVRMDPDIWRELRHYAVRNKISNGVAMERAILLLLEKKE